MPPTPETTLRFLVACPACRRQFDATKLKAGSRFHCLCGETVKVPRAESHHASVVRCSSCNAPRTQKSSSCSHCGAGFTLNERDLHTICPGCMTRVHDRARFCHHCALELRPEGLAGARTDFRCPICGVDEQLNSRDIGEPPMPILECPSCAGLWLRAEGFQSLVERSRKAGQTESEDLATAVFGTPTSSPMAASGPVYRNCPDCGELMHRRNYGKRSGVIIDTCKSHGVWFDAQELERILSWIREGGEARARDMELASQRESASQEQFVRTLRSSQWGAEESRSSQGAFPAILERFLGSLFRF